MAFSPEYSMQENIGRYTMKALFFDLDGTLLDSTKRIPDSAVEALQAARAKGVRVYLASARSPRLGQTLGWTEREFDLFDGGVYSNGGYVEAAGRGRYAFIDPQAVRGCVEAVSRREDIHLSLHSPGHGYTLNFPLTETLKSSWGITEENLRPLDDRRLLPPDTQELISQLYTLAERSMNRYLDRGDDDFSFAITGLARFRVSAYRQRGSLAVVIRVVSFSIPNWEQLNIPAEVMALAEVSHGMILVTGTAGSGKSTTQACIIDRINHNRDCHIITLEDPIEHLHRNDRSIISQREIAIDTEDYLSGLRACLRQAPDVILLGEMRDAETIRTAMTAAETGHTVIATLHTKGTANSIDRIIDAFPAEQQGQIRVQLAAVLHTVVSQQLLPGTAGKQEPAF